VNSLSNRRWPHARWLSIASLISVVALSLAAGATGAAAASLSTSQTHPLATIAISARSQPHAVTPGLRPGTTQHMNSTTAAPPCNDQFNVVPSQNAGANQNNELNSVSAISSTDAYAVGDVDVGTTTVLRRAVTEHWDGTAWTLTTSQPTAVGTGDNTLLSVSAVATNSVWAVGYSKADNNTGTLRNILIEHYDGTTWAATADTTTNNPAGSSNSLFGIKFFSPTDIWAVGETAASATQVATLIEHYDGTAWTTQTGGTAGSVAYLADVLPLAANNVYAVGGQSNQPLIEHYNGTTWTTITGPFPLPNTNGAFFNDIAGVAGDIWAVGGQFKSNTTDSTLIWHYDGNNWSALPSPTPDLSANLSAVRYGATNDVWAVGASAYLAPATVDELDHTLIEHWDGSTWRQVASPNPGNFQDLFDVAIAGPNQVLTVGFTQDTVAGTASSTLAADLCEPTPAVTSLNPDHGWSSGGNPIQIMGSGLAYPRSVMFGTIPATSFTANSDSMITAVPPAQPVGSVVNVTVTTMGGTSATGAGNQYTNFGPGPWRNNGGVLASQPAALTWGFGRLDAFVSGTDGVLYHWVDNGTFVGWEGLPGVQPASDASAVSVAGPPTGPGVIDLFVRGSDGALWHRNYTNVSAGSWSPWEKLGGMITGAPAAVSLGAGNIDVFVQGTDNHLWYDSLVGTTWTWHLAGGQLGAPPAAVSGAIAGQTDAFVMGNDSALWRYTITSTTTSWAPSLGGRLAAKPAATVRGTALDVFVEGLDAGLWHWSTQASGGGWEGVGGKLAAAPTAVSWGSSRLDVFVEGTDSALYHAWSTSSGVGAPWRWEWVGGKLMGSPAAVTWGVNRLDAFVRGTDNHLWHIAFD
jgi:IPT/TIG domain